MTTTTGGLSVQSGSGSQSSSMPPAQQVKEVAATAKDAVQTQTGQIVGQLGTQLRSEAGRQQQRAGDGIREIARQLTDMSATADSGMPKQTVQALAQRLDDFAGYIETHDPGQWLSQANSFARRRPAAVLLGGLALGFVAERATRVMRQGDGSSSVGGDGFGRSSIPAMSSSGFGPGIETGTGVGSGFGIEPPDATIGLQTPSDDPLRAGADPAIQHDYETPSTTTRSPGSGRPQGR